jgi:hypothetical protein
MSDVASLLEDLIQEVKGLRQEMSDGILALRLAVKGQDEEPLQMATDEPGVVKWYKPHRQFGRRHFLRRTRLRLRPGGQPRCRPSAD